MAWVRTEDTARLHPKFFRAGVAAWGWWNAALGYCNQHLSDGFIPSSDLLLVFPGTEGPDVLTHLATLVAEGLVHMVNVGKRVKCDHRGCRAHRPVREGYLMHDFKDFQPSREKVIKKRRARSAAGREGGRKSGISRQQFASPPAKQTRSKNEPRPDPTRKEHKKLLGGVAVATDSGSNGAGAIRGVVVSTGHFADCDCPTCVKRREALMGEPEATR